MEARLATLSPAALTAIDCLLLLFFGCSVLACVALVFIAVRVKPSSPMPDRRELPRNVRRPQPQQKVSLSMRQLKAMRNTRTKEPRT